ncbi:hypothetical protein BJ875DRAFT_368980 [Amylocarpus encephaloides]|uniref:Rhodopsin domain-containing protein n=1 Tax=Amylocarpus encephaloides TaxID=45428 RepID=A0A9P8CAA2_9HELO|nr:hypothetical protein BJ875DRAFT_368980 [Amylocarpus encephaloides]
MLTPSYLKRVAAENFIIGPTLWASKATILALYIQLFGKTHPWLRSTSYIALVLSFGFYWANTPLTGVFCVPKSGHSWDMSLIVSCSKLAIMAPLQGAIGLAADLFILALPIPIVWGLNLPLRKKAGALIVFCAGSFAVIASTVSLYYRVMVWLGHDPLWNGSKITITTFVEGFVTIMVSCAPAMSSFWLNIVTKSNLYSSVTSRRASTSNVLGTTEKGVDSDNSSEFSKRRQSPASNSYWYGSANYEQTDAFYGKLSTTTEVRSYEVDISASKGYFITKQMTLDQSSERALR